MRSASTGQCGSPAGRSRGLSAGWPAPSRSHLHEVGVGAGRDPAAGPALAAAAEGAQQRGRRSARAAARLPRPRRAEEQVGVLGPRAEARRWRHRPVLAHHVGEQRGHRPLAVAAGAHVVAVAHGRPARPRRPAGRPPRPPPPRPPRPPGPPRRPPPTTRGRPRPGCGSRPAPAGGSRRLGLDPVGATAQAGGGHRVGHVEQDHQVGPAAVRGPVAHHPHLGQRRGPGRSPGRPARTTPTGR